MKKIILIVALLSAVIFYFVAVDKKNNDLSLQLKASVMEQNSDKKISKFSLLDHNNQEFNNENLKNKWTLLLFIYTHCPDVCPTELSNVAMLKGKMTRDKSTVIPGVVAITFDPIRDTPGIMKDYVTYFDKDFVGVSGDGNQIDQLVQDFNAYYDKTVYGKNGELITLQNYEPLPDDAIEKGYLINHTASIYLINPDGKLHASFPTPHNPLDMAKDIDLIIKNY